MSPVHAVMMFHNVETNEEIWDYKATDKDLLRVVKDNIVGTEGIEAKKRAAEDREAEWEKLLRDRSSVFFAFVAVVACHFFVSFCSQRLPPPTAGSTLLVPPPPPPLVAQL